MGRPVLVDTRVDIVHVGRRKNVSRHKQIKFKAATSCIDVKELWPVATKHNAVVVLAMIGKTGVSCDAEDTPSCVRICISTEIQEEDQGLATATPEEAVDWFVTALLG